VKDTSQVFSSTLRHKAVIRRGIRTM
jgi:hypothetical protein